MPRLATTVDAFAAIGEPRRREILDVLSTGEMAVNDVVAVLGIAQPQVSKHLGVLKEVGLVASRRRGRQQLYRVNGAALRPVHDWAQSFERLWNERFDQLDELLEELKQKEDRDERGA
ncbi:MAG TPA: metalloregulator ArsR/SmtB family transcription factor [Acidimicrobiia bacterium]|jgi:DNA-binding transcriptional ArsR family regulator